MPEPCKRCLYPIIGNYDGSLEAIDCRVHSVRYDIAHQRSWRQSQMPHQVTYDVVATPIRPNNA
eukprot:scaffold18363_cov105-Skeletonema_dohrnii-CCMP3373.AAC.5